MFISNYIILYLLINYIYYYYLLLCIIRMTLRLLDRFDHQKMKLLIFRHYFLLLNMFTYF